MRGSIVQRCACSTRKDAAGRIERDARGKSVKDHRPGCRPKWGYVFDGSPQANGKRNQVTKTGFSTRREAERALAAALDAEARGVRVQTGRLTVGQYLDDWLESRVRLRPSTARSYEAHVRLYLRPGLGGLKLTDLRHSDVERIFARLVQEGRIKPATIKRVHATLSKALNDAVRRNLLGVNHAQHVELPVVTKRPFTIWTPSQLAYFLSATRDDRLWPIYRLAAFTGMRRGELAGLRWDDVDLDRGAVHVRQQRVQLGYAVVEGPPKTQRGVRVVDLDRATVEVLRDHAVGQGAERVLAGDVWKDQGWVFTREDGSPIHPERITRTFTRLAAGLGLPSIRLHDLRHGYASHALAAGANMKIIQNQLGHGSYGFTADTYTHVQPHVAADAAEIIARLLLAADPALADREQGGPETDLGALPKEKNAQVTRVRRQGLEPRTRGLRVRCSAS